MDAAQQPQLNPWDQQPGEPDYAYGYFCVFRSLGPGRTMTRAYRAVNAMRGGAEQSEDLASLWIGRGRVRTRRPETREGHAPGSWRGYAFKWKWKARAAAWDRNVLGQRLQDIVHMWAKALQNMTAKLVRSSAQLTPDTYADMIEGMNLVGGQIPPEAYDALANHPPEDGGPEKDREGGEGTVGVPDRPGGVCDRAARYRADS